MTSRPIVTLTQQPGEIHVNVDLTPLAPSIVGLAVLFTILAIVVIRANFIAHQTHKTMIKLEKRIAEWEIDDSCDLPPEPDVQLSPPSNSLS